MYYFCGLISSDAIQLTFDDSMRYALYDVNSRVLSFVTFAKIITLAKEQKIRGLESCFSEGNEIYLPKTFYEYSKDKGLVIQPFMETMVSNPSSILNIQTPVIFDKLFSGATFVYKLLRVRVFSSNGKICLNIVPQLDSPMAKVVSDTLNTFVEMLEELAVCLSYNNSDNNRWYVTLPKTKYMDLSLLDNFQMAGKDVFFELSVDTYNTNTLKMKCLNKHEIRFAGLFDNTYNTIKELDLTDINPKSLMKRTNKNEFQINKDGLKKIVFITNKLMKPFGLIKFSMEDEELTEEIFCAINRRLRTKVENRLVPNKAEQVYVKYLGVHDKNEPNIIDLSKNTISAMHLMGRTNTVFIANVK